MPKAAKGGKKPAAKRKSPAAATPDAEPEPLKRPKRTPQNPFEETEDTTYEVEKMVNMRWQKGSREYLVRWAGYPKAGTPIA